MSAIIPSDFFLKERSLPETKSEILGNFFEAWCSARLTGTALPEPALYIDLCATPGTGQEHSLPATGNLLKSIYRGTANLLDLNSRLRAIFGNKDKGALENLRQQLEQLPFHEKLAHQPLFLAEATDQELFTESLRGKSPALALLDPFEGAYPASLQKELVARDATDLLLLLCPERLNKALIGRPGKLVADLFGLKVPLVKAYFKREKDLGRREEFALRMLKEALQENGYFTVQLSIYPPDREGLGHKHLLATKDGATYRAFKESLLPYIAFQEDGVPLFYTSKKQQNQLAMFVEQPNYTIEALALELEQKSSIYKYKMIEKVYEDHSLGTDYIRENYVEAFKLLRNNGQVEFLNPKTMQPIKMATATSVVKFKTS